MAGMANNTVRIVLIALLIYLGIIAFGAICAFRFTTHPWIWILLLVGVFPVLTGIARGIMMAVKGNKK